MAVGPQACRLPAAAAAARNSCTPRLRHPHAWLLPRSRPAPQHLAAASAAGAPPGRGGSSQAPMQAVQLRLSHATSDAQKQLNSQLCAAEAAEELMQLVQQHLPAFNVVNAVTAFHRLAKVGAPPGGRGAAARSAAIGSGCNLHLLWFALGAVMVSLAVA